MQEAPRSLDAEKAVLGAVLISPRAFPDVDSDLAVDDFYLPAHREIFEAMRALTKREAPIDVLAVEDELKSRGTFRHLQGGPAYLVQIAKSPPLAENVRHYTRIVRDKSILRNVISLCGEATARAFAEQDSAGVVETLSRELAALVVRRGSGLVRLGSAASDLYAEFERREREGPRAAITGIKSGIDKLDENTFGFQPQQLVVIAADTSGGKTSLAMQAAFNLVLEDRGVVMACSLEMSLRELAERAFAHLAVVNSHMLKMGILDKKKFQRLAGVGTRIGDAPIYVEDQIGSLREVIAKARSWRTRHPTEKGMLIVDFLQLVRSEPKKGENRARELGIVAQELKTLAKQLDIAVVLVSQLNRDPAKSKRAPTKFDLKESGDTENAADVILLIHNPEETTNGEVTIIIDKNRNGPSHVTVTAKWLARFYRFANPWDDYSIGDDAPPGGAGEVQ